MNKENKAIILFTGIVIIIVTLATYVLLGRYDLGSFVVLALPGFLFVSIGILMGKKLKGRVYMGGIVAFLVWIIFEVLFILWMAKHSI